MTNYLSEEHSDRKQLYKRVGRLCGKDSIQALPTELRYMLFKEDEYEHFDISNSHPGILLDYATEHELVLKGALKSYVENRQECLALIESQLSDLVLKALRKGKSTIKTYVLSHMKRTWIMQTSGSILFDRLDADFHTIRLHM